MTVHKHDLAYNEGIICYQCLEQPGHDVPCYTRHVPQKQTFVYVHYILEIQTIFRLTLYIGLYKRIYGVYSQINVNHRYNR